MKNKVILITGASSGIGKATAVQLIAEGHKVYGLARRISEMKGLEEIGGKIMAMDITKDEDIIQTVNTIIKVEGRIDVLINNAGYAIYGAIEDTKLIDVRRQFEVNLFGLGRITQLVLPHMRESRSGMIVNISSMGGKMYTPLGAWYHASKHALEGWSDCLRLELKQFGIKVVIIEPGIIRTEFAEVMTQPLIDRSGQTPYGNLARAVAYSTVNTYKEGNSSSPSVVSKIISKAINSRRPKTRYVVGKMARLLMFIRKYFGDRIFDKVLMSQVKQ